MRMMRMHMKVRTAQTNRSLMVMIFRVQKGGVGDDDGDEDGGVMKRRRKSLLKGLYVAAGVPGPVALAGPSFEASDIGSTRCSVDDHDDS
jgi:hypothetical protein